MKTTIVLEDDQGRRFVVEAEQAIVDEKYIVQYKHNLYSHFGSVQHDETSSLPYYKIMKLPAWIG